MQIDDAVVSRRLEQVRLRHGLARGSFVPQPPEVDVDEDLTNIAQVENLFHPSGLLIRHGQPVLAYIRDHTSFGTYLAPEKCRKVHFTVCTALKSMKRQGRFERYRITNRETNRYLVDVSTTWGRTNERETELYPCQYCLGNVKYQNFHYGMASNEKRSILMNFDVKDLFLLLRRRLTRFSEHNFQLRRAMRNAKPATLPSGYPRNWKEISEHIRQLRNYTCEECGVGLGNHPSLLDVHHIDGDKQNVQDLNLRCLCKLCHHGEHSHYKVDMADKLLILTQRVRQRPGGHQVE